MEKCTPKNSIPVIYIKGKWCDSVVIKFNCGNGIFFKTHIPNKSNLEEKIMINWDFKININMDQNIYHRFRIIVIILEVELNSLTEKIWNWRQLGRCRW